ncbi:Zinc finger protein 746 [Blattella germanica]|nr:Zinc finger protein 746 [Blattella germanica]
MRTLMKEHPFPCEVCNKTFTQTNHLISYDLTHSGVRPFSCNLCSKSFFRKHNLSSLIL